jgi:hypothetical protein
MLGQAEQGLHAGVVRRDQGAVDQARLRLGVGECGDDDQLLGVGDDHPLDRVVVVRRTAQGGDPLAHFDDPGQRPVVARGVADHAHPVADHDALATERSRLHRHHLVAVEQERVAAPVDGDDHAVDGVVVGGAVLGAGARTPARTVVVLDVLVGVAVAHDGIRPDQKSAKSGNVLPVVPMFSTCTSSTAAPTITPAWAIRWSA